MTTRSKALADPEQEVSPPSHLFTRSSQLISAPSPRFQVICNPYSPPLSLLPTEEEMRNLGLLTIFGPKSRQSASARPTNPSTSPAPGYDVIEDFEDRSPYEKKTHHFHIYSTKHNTHITLSNPDRDSIISLSAGNIGFRKGARGTYDAAYQLTTYVIGRMQEEGLLDKITSLEVVLRGFGIGREAVVKALLGTEGRLLRKKITQVTDSTRLKFGGTRSRKPRRLG